MAVTGLLDLEAGVLRNTRSPDLRARLEDCPAAAGHVDEQTDPVLLACCDDWLQEGDGGRAMWLAALRVAAGDDDPALQALAAGFDEDAWPRSALARSRTGGYLRARGYGPDPQLAFVAMADTFLGRVHRTITHPALGARCVTWYGNIVRDRGDGRIYDALGHRLVTACARQLAVWSATGGASRRRAEERLLGIAGSWVTRRAVPPV